VTSFLPHSGPTEIDSNMVQPTPEAKCPILDYATSMLSGHLWHQARFIVK
jgi:hypothetical protein